MLIAIRTVKEVSNPFTEMKTERVFLNTNAITYVKIDSSVENIQYKGEDVSLYKIKLNTGEELTAVGKLYKSESSVVVKKEK